MSGKGKSRKSRFSEEECSVLIAEFGKQKDMITSKFCDSVTLQKKKKAWDKVHLAVNSVNPSAERTVPEIKKKWQEIKSRTKSKEGKRRKEIKKTGGGRADFESLTPNEEEAIAVIGDTAIEGITEGFDSNEAVQVDQEVEDAPMTSEPEDDAARSVASTSTMTVEEQETKSRARRSRTSSSEYLEMRDLEIVDIEKERLEVEKKRLSIESQRLAIEQRRLQIEEKRLQLEMMQKASYTYQSEAQNSSHFEPNEPIYTSL